MKDPFEILECNSKMSREEIKKKYRNLAFKYHPDRNCNLNELEKNDAESKFKEITCAYSFLEKNNFKYSPLENEFGDFTTKFGAFSANFGKIGNIINSIRNMDLDNIANHILKEVNHIQDFYNGENETLKKSQDININARVDLVDIYNNVKKEVKLSCLKKCKLCMGLGYNINDKKKCIDCNGNKILMEEITITFFPNLKTRQLLRQGNEEPGKRPGDININIFPKNVDSSINDFIYRTIDDYNILYKLILTDKMIFKEQDKQVIKHSIEYLDLKWRQIIILNPKQEFIVEYNFNELGLLNPDFKRGNLIVMLIDKYNLINTDKSIECAIEIKLEE